jgi:sucrose phosphorylase
MLKVRKANPAFHPWGEQKILFINKNIFAVLRAAVDRETQTLCLHNVTSKSIKLVLSAFDLPFHPNQILIDVLNNQHYPISNGNLRVDIAPYQVIWLKNT